MLKNRRVKRFGRFTTLSSQVDIEQFTGKRFFLYWAFACAM
jgi:hypothetical protein